VEIHHRHIDLRILQKLYMHIHDILVAGVVQSWCTIVAEPEVVVCNSARFGKLSLFFLLFPFCNFKCKVAVVNPLW